MKKAILISALFLFIACGGSGGDVEGPTDEQGNPLPTESQTTINCDESGNPVRCEDGACVPVEGATDESGGAKMAWKIRLKIGDITIEGVVQCGAEINISETTVTTETDINSNNPSTSTETNS